MAANPSQMQSGKTKRAVNLQMMLFIIAPLGALDIEDEKVRLE